MNESILWSPSKKLLFRFFAVYLLLYILSNQFILTFLIDPLWEIIVPWFGNYILGIDYNITNLHGGSGDKTYDYVLLLLIVIITVISASFWSLLDKSRLSYQKFLDWLVVLIRYYLIFQMLLYGMGKVFYLQMGPPSPERLEQPLGEFSPMGLVWTFVGYSKGFTMMTGWFEVLGGVLLMFKRTQTLGAMVVFVVMANVMAFNYFYDVPVKLLSTHIVLMTIFLISLDGSRLWKVLISNKPTESREIRYLFQKARTRKILGFVKWALIVVYISLNVYSGIEGYKAVYLVDRESYVVLKVGYLGRTSLKKDEPKISDWKKIKVIDNRVARIHSYDDKTKAYKFQVDLNRKIVACESVKTKEKDTLNITFYNTNIMNLRGVIEGDSLSVRLARDDNYNLMKYKFRWINESPDNR